MCYETVSEIAQSQEGENESNDGPSDSSRPRTARGLRRIASADRSDDRRRRGFTARVDSAIVDAHRCDLKVRVVVVARVLDQIRARSRTARVKDSRLSSPCRRDEYATESAVGNEHREGGLYAQSPQRAMLIVSC